MNKRIGFFLIIILYSCANIVAPVGGAKDQLAPKIESISILRDSKDSYEKTIKFVFDEYIQLNNWEDYFYISPPIKKSKKKINGNLLLLTITDSLDENTSYNICLNSCIKDNNEGNILDTLNYIYNDQNSELLGGKLVDAYTLKELENFWVMLFNEQMHDSLIFKSSPIYISKTDKNGLYHFPNLKSKKYKLVAINGYDFIYNNDELIAFSDKIINSKTDSFITLFAFNPQIDNDKVDSLLINYSLDTLISKNEISNYGQIEIITKDSMSAIFQLLQKDKVVSEFYFDKKPYLIKKILAGKYQLKYILDNNNDKIFSTGDWLERRQPEKVFNYPSEILIRSNWNLELEWIISE